MLRFTNNLHYINNTHFESGNRLQYFMLAGFHEPDFYTTNEQADVDYFLSTEVDIIDTLNKVKQQVESENISLSEDLDHIIGLHQTLLDSVKLLKELYFKKGFKDYGTEGDMRRYAHYLEDSTRMAEVDVLMLRRHEKDYLMRGEERYIDEFNTLAEKYEDKYAYSPVIMSALDSYRYNFNELATYASQLGIYKESSVYTGVNDIVNRLDRAYIDTNDKISEGMARLTGNFKTTLFTVSLLLLAFAVFLSIYLSNILTRSIKKLNRRVVSFVNSRFTDDSFGTTERPSRITEVAQLGASFTELKLTLHEALTELEKAIAEEKTVSQHLERNIATLKKHVEEIEIQKTRLALSEAKLNAFFNSSESIHVMVNADTGIVALNNVANRFVNNRFGKDAVIGNSILDYLNDSYKEKFKEDFSKVLLGASTTEERKVTYEDGSAIWWLFQILPIANDKGVVYAVSFNATDITDRKVHEQKIKAQNEALLKIAHVQSHEIRGPVTTIKGLMNIIKTENKFTPEYLTMLEDAVEYLDRKIFEVVDYTRPVDK